MPQPGVTVAAKHEMTIKGTAFLARRRLLTDAGKGRELDALVAQLGREHRVFAAPVLASTRIPLSQWTVFSDALIAQFYGGDEMAYWRFGHESAAFALRGPYKNLARDRDIEGFAHTVAAAWKLYYSHGHVDAAWRGEALRYCIEDVPVHHVYLEYSACGWVERGLQLTGAPVTEWKRVQGFSQGDARVEYLFSCDLSSIPRR